MKKNKLKYSLSLIGFFVLAFAHAQTPYDAFAPEQSKKEMLKGEEVKYIIYNTDTTSHIKYATYDSEAKTLVLYSVGDSLLNAFQFSPRDKKWWSVDPKASKYPQHSPYNAFANNPIMYTDPDGQEIVDAQGRKVNVINNNGKVTFEFDDKATKAEKNKFNKESGKIIKAMIKIQNGDKLLEQVNSSIDKYRFDIVDENFKPQQGTDPLDLGGELATGNIVPPLNTEYKYSFTDEGKTGYKESNIRSSGNAVIQIQIDIEAIKKNMKSENNSGDIVNRMKSKSTNENIGIIAYTYANFMINNNGMNMLKDIRMTTNTSQKSEYVKKANVEVQNSVPSF